MIDTAERHPATQNGARWLTANPNLPEGRPRLVASMFEEFASDLIRLLPDGAELTAGLRKLVEAKDCVVRAALEPGQ